MFLIHVLECLNLREKNCFGVGQLGQEAQKVFQIFLHWLYIATTPSLVA